MPINIQPRQTPLGALSMGLTGLATGYSTGYAAGAPSVAQAELGGGQMVASAVSGLSDTFNRQFTNAYNNTFQYLANDALLTRRQNHEVAIQDAANRAAMERIPAMAAADLNRLSFTRTGAPLLDMGKPGTPEFMPGNYSLWREHVSAPGAPVISFPEFMEQRSIAFGQSRQAKALWDQGLMLGEPPADTPEGRLWHEHNNGIRRQIADIQNPNSEAGARFYVDTPAGKRLSDAGIMEITRLQARLKPPVPVPRPRTPQEIAADEIGFVMDPSTGQPLTYPDGTPRGITWGQGKDRQISWIPHTREGGLLNRIKTNAAGLIVSPGMDPGHIRIDSETGTVFRFRGTRTGGEWIDTGLTPEAYNAEKLMPLLPSGARAIPQPDGLYRLDTSEQNVAINWLKTELDAIDSRYDALIKIAEHESAAAEKIINETSGLFRRTTREQALEKARENDPVGPLVTERNAAVAAALRRYAQMTRQAERPPAAPATAPFSAPAAGPASAPAAPDLFGTNSILEGWIYNQGISDHAAIRIRRLVQLAQQGSRSAQRGLDEMGVPWR